MSVNVVKYGDQTVMDISDATVTPQALAEGFTAYNAAGEKIDGAMQQPYVWIRYAAQQPSASAPTISATPDAWMGVYSGTAATAPTVWSAYQWYNIKGATGANGKSIKVFATSYKYPQDNVNVYSQYGRADSWAVKEDTSGVNVNDLVMLQVFNTSKNGDCFVLATVTAIAEKRLSTISVGLIDKGDTGTRGSRWTTGTAITGTSTTATVFSGSGITDALVNDMYLNTSTGCVYKCTVAGAAAAAKWVYAGSIKGPQGAADASALLKSGGTMTGTLTTKGIVLTQGVDYGTSLPSTVTPGKLFFKKVS